MLLAFAVAARANVNAAALAKLDPAASREFAISGADCISVNVVTAREIACAWQALAHLQIVADDAEDDLCHQLFANRHFTVF